MVQEAKVRVRLDTSLAKSDLQGVVNAAQGTAARIGGTIRQQLGAGVNAAGNAVSGTIAGATGGALAALRGPTQGTASALMTDVFGALATQLEMAVFGKAGPEAKAASQARDWAIQIGSFNAQDAESRTRLVSHFEARRKIMERFEVGRQAIEGDTRFYAHAMPGTDMIGRFAETMGKVLKEAVQSLLSGIKALWPL